MKLLGVLNGLDERINTVRNRLPALLMAIPAAACAYALLYYAVYTFFGYVPGFYYVLAVMFILGRIAIGLCGVMLVLWSFENGRIMNLAAGILGIARACFAFVPFKSPWAVLIIRIAFYVCLLWPELKPKQKKKAEASALTDEGRLALVSAGVLSVLNLFYAIIKMASAGHAVFGILAFIYMLAALVTLAALTLVLLGLGESERPVTVICRALPRRFKLGRVSFSMEGNVNTRPAVQKAAQPEKTAAPKPEKTELKKPAAPKKAKADEDDDEPKFELPKLKLPKLSMPKLDTSKLKLPKLGAPEEEEPDDLAGLQSETAAPVIQTVNMDDLSAAAETTPIAIETVKADDLTEAPAEKPAADDFSDYFAMFDAADVGSGDDNA